MKVKVHKVGDTRGAAKRSQEQAGADRSDQGQPGAARRGTQGKGPRNLQKTTGRWEAPKRHFS